MSFAELRKAFADEMPLDAPLAISKGEEGSLDAPPFKQDGETKSYEDFTKV